MMEEEAGRKVNRSLLSRRKGSTLVASLPTLVSLYLVGAGLVFLICARTFLAYHIYLLTSTASLQPFQFGSPDQGVHPAVPGEESSKIFAPDQRDLGIVEEGDGPRYTTLDVIGGGESSEIEETAVGEVTHQESGEDDLDVSTSKEAGAGTGRGSESRQESEDSREKLHRMSARERRLWLKRNWQNFQVLQSDGRSDQFLMRMHRFLCGQHVVTGKVTDKEIPHGRDPDSDVKHSVGQGDRRSLGVLLNGVSIWQLPRREIMEGTALSQDLPHVLEASGDEVDAESIPQDASNEDSKDIQESGGEIACGIGDGPTNLNGNHCGQRFFMTWISPVSTFGLRERLSLESVFKWHPLACVVIFSRSLDSEGGRKILEPFRFRGYRVMAVLPDLSSLFSDTPAENWFRKLRQGAGDPGEINLMQNLSNIIRLVALYKYGGIYLDTDIIVLKNLSDLSNVVGAQSSDPETGKWTRLNNAVMIFDRKHPVVHKFIKEFAHNFDGSKWGHNGPYLVSRVVKKIAKSEQSHLISVLEPRAFYPVNWNNIVPFFRAPLDQAETRWQEAELERLRQQSYAIHLWNKMTGLLEVEKGSIMERLFQQSCIFCKAAGRPAGS